VNTAPSLSTSSLSMDNKDIDDDGPPKRGVVSGGWDLASDDNESKAESKMGYNDDADVGGGSKPSRRGFGPGSRRKKNEANAESKSKRNRHFDNDDDEILVIPDLEDAEDEDITTKVAEAPRNTQRKVQSMRELNFGVKNALQTQNSGINLGLLTSTLSPPHLLTEDDLPWEFDSLLQTVSQEIQIELDAVEKSKEDEKGDDAPIKNRSSGRCVAFEKNGVEV